MNRGRRQPASGDVGWWARRTLRARLGIAVIALTAAVSIVIGVVSVFALQAFLEQRLDDSLTSAVRRTRSAVNRPPSNSVSTVPPSISANRFAFRNSPVPFLAAPGQAQGTLGGIIEEAGNLRAAYLDSAGEQAYLTSAQRDLIYGIVPDEKPHTVDLGGDLGPYRVLAQRTPEGETLITGLPLNGVHEAVIQLVLVITLVTVAGLLLAAGVGTAIVRRTLRPLNRVAATATRVTELPLDRGEVDLHKVRVAERDTDIRTEVGAVGAALNRMLGHVGSALQARQSSEARTRRFVADASHELRTPLASIRGYAELTRRSGQNVPPDIAHALSRVESEAIRMTSLVEELLMLARLDEGRPARRDEVDLSRLLVDAVGDAHAAGPSHSWHLDLPDEPVSVIGDELQLHTVVANLLANARVHTPAGTSVRASLDSSGVLRVSDDGPGIPAALLPEIFERFTRGDESRNRATGSTGLGLSIVAGVVAAHGGAVAVESHPGATTFTVRFPRVPQQSPLVPTP